MIRCLRNFIAMAISFATLSAMFSCSKPVNELAGIYFTNVKNGEVTIGVGNDFRIHYLLDPEGIGVCILYI